MDSTTVLHPNALEKSLRKLRSARLLHQIACELLESRQLLSGNDYLDRIDFGNVSSESLHQFDVGATSLPAIGIGGLNSAYSYRQPNGVAGTNHPYGSALGVQKPANQDQVLTFTLNVDPNHQNYLTVKLWGNDTEQADLQLLNTPTNWDALLQHSSSTIEQAPNQFYYVTDAIPLSWTSGLHSVQLTLYESNASVVGAPAVPIYSAFTSINPYFIPDSTDANGTAPALTGQLSLTALTGSQVDSTLEANRTAIFKSGGYYQTQLADQITKTNAPNAPAEVIGLSLGQNVATWVANNPNATADQWRDAVATQQAGPGYSAVPDQFLSVLYDTYLLKPYVNTSGQTVSGLDDYHDSATLTDIVSALDGSTYLQGSDGGFGGGYGSYDWDGITSTARGSSETNIDGVSTGTGRFPDPGFLGGIDDQTLGWTIVSLLNDPNTPTSGGTSNPKNFIDYLGGTFNANLNGTAVLRATAYEAMLYGVIQSMIQNPGGTVSQNLFEMTGLYASEVGLEKLQALFPNSTYSYSDATAVNYVQQVMGLAPSTLQSTGISTSNDAISSAGFGEAHGTLSGGYDGGYGEILPWLATHIAQLAQVDPGLSSSPATVSSIVAVARNTINGFDQFISAEPDDTGSAASFTLAPEDYVTYRNTGGANSLAGAFNVDSQYNASDPTAGINDAYALRSAYLEALYSKTPVTNASDEASLNYLRTLSSYESTLKSLVGVNPSTLTALPGEPNQGNFAFADVQEGVAAVMNDGERIYINADWRNYENNNNAFGIVSNLARVHDTTASNDRMALIEMDSSGATAQSDGNVSGGINQPWFARYGDYLVAFNNSTSATTVKLPAGVGLAEDLLTRTFYSLGTTQTLPAGRSMILWLAASSVTAALSTGADVGAVGVAGSNSYSSGNYTLTGSGDISGSSDTFHFVSSPLSGNGSIVAQVSSQTSDDGLSQAGVMIRDGTAANAAFAAVVRTTGGGVRFEYRSSAGITMAWNAAPLPLSAVWFELVRSGSSISGFYSVNGIAWTQVGSAQTLTFTSTAQAGLVVSSHSSSAASTAVFSNVQLGATPTVATPAAASATTTTASSVNLSALGADAGGQSNLTYTWQSLNTAPASVTFSANGTNAAQNTTATFAAAGTYPFQVVITNAAGLSVTGLVTVTVQQILTLVSVLPISAVSPLVVPESTTVSLAPVALDQFGAPLLAAQTFTWSVSSGVGSVNAAGVYTAPASAGSATIKATTGGVSGSISLTVPAAVGTFIASQDVGSPAIAGSSSYSGTTYTVSGAGTDIYSQADQFQFGYKMLTGDGSITAEVLTESNSSTVKAGVMIRNSLDTGSMFADAFVQPSSGISFQGRTSTGGSSNTFNSSAFAGAVPYWVRLTRVANTITAYASPNGTTWTQVGTAQSIAFNSTVYVGLVTTSVNSSKLATATFNNVTVAQATRVFTNVQSIGEPTIPGTYTDSNSAATATLTAESSDIYNASDQFTYAYDVLTGAATLVARVTSQTNTSASAKAGLMFRGSTAANAPFVDLVVTPGGIDLMYRSTTGASVPFPTISASAVTPVWLKLVRSGSTFTGYYSTSTTTPSSYTKIGSTTVTLGTSADAGLAVSSNNTGSLGTVNFTNIAVTGTANVSPTVSKAAAATTTAVTGTTDGLTVTGADSDGGTSNLTYTWSLIGEPPAPVSFSANGTNGASSTTATFAKAGTYQLLSSISDSGGATVTSPVTVTVNPTLTSLTVTPASTSVGPVATDAVSAIPLDQFGNAMSASTPTWSVSGGGSVDSNGNYTAPAVSASTTVTATLGSVTGSTAITVVNQSPLIANSATPAVSTSPVAVNTPVTLSVAATDDGGTSNLLYSWAATTLANGAAAPAFSGNTNGTNAASSITASFSSAGNYVLTVTITDPGGATTTATVPVTVTQPIAATAAINSGASQRSLVTNVTYTFNQAVTLGSSALTIALHPSSADGSTTGTLPTLAWTSPDGGITWIVTFSGAGVVNGSIADGMYDLTLNAQQVQNSSFQTLTASVVTPFLRLFGDYDGNGKVNNADNARFSSAYGSLSGQSNYIAFFDYDGNGKINNLDNAQFSLRYGKVLIL